MVGVVREVVADEDVEQGAVAAEVDPGEDDEVAFAGVDGEVGGPVETAGVAGEHCRGDEHGRAVAGRGEGEHLGLGGGVAADGPEEEGAVVGGHATTMGPGADDPLTAT